MVAQDGLGWLKVHFAEAVKTQKKVKTPHHSKVYEVKVLHDIELKFDVYGSRTVYNPATGKVAGSEQTETGKEVLSVPAGTEVRIYGDPARIAVGSSVATFFIADKQTTYKRERNLVHKTVPKAP